MSLTGLISSVAGITVNWVSSLGYWGIAIGMVLESCNIPLPSEVILPFAGFLVFSGKLGFWEAVMAGTLGGTAGSAASYFLGKWGGRPLVERYGYLIGINKKKLFVADQFFIRRGEATVFFARLLPVVRTFISLPAGTAKMPLGRFLLYTFLGSLPWSVFLVYLGLKLGQHWSLLESWFHRFDVLIVLGLVLLLLYYMISKRKDRRI